MSSYIYYLGIYFDTGLSVLKPESKVTLDEIAKLVKADPSEGRGRVFY